MRLGKALGISMAVHGSLAVALVGWVIRQPRLLGSSTDGGNGWATFQPMVVAGLPDQTPGPEAGPPELSVSPEEAVVETGVAEPSMPPPTFAPEAPVGIGGHVSSEGPTKPPPAPHRAAEGGSAGPRAGEGESLGSAGEMPGLLSNDPPAYPAEAKRCKLEGTAVIALRVSAEGRVVEVTLVESSGHEVLDREALSALARWRFSARPGAGEVRLVQKVVFRLENGKP